MRKPRNGKPTKLDRRVLYRQQHILAGLCTDCPLTSVRGNLCRKHLKRRYLAQRRRKGNVKQYKPQKQAFGKVV